jgi:cytochrome c-type biogenesis protein
MMLLILYFGLIAFVHSFSPKLSTRTALSSTINLRETQLSMDLSSDFGVFLYDTQLTFSRAIETNLLHPSPYSILLLFTAGLITALSPCAMSLVPLTVASLNSNTNTKNEQIISSVMYTVGLASVLSLLGISAAVLGSAVSDKGGLITEIPAFLAAVLSVVMGLNLLNIITLEFPNFELSENLKGFTYSKELKAFTLGASSALVASPCSSPVLTSLLAIVASSGNPSLGVIFLFAYSLGYAAPIVFAGSLSQVMNNLSSNFDTTNAIVASLLITYGTYSSLDVLSRIFV